jgi:hypothetical protein
LPPIKPAPPVTRIRFFPCNALLCFSYQLSATSSWLTADRLRLIAFDVAY